MSFSTYAFYSMQLYFQTLNYAAVKILGENMLAEALITRALKMSQTSYALPQESSTFFFQNIIYSEKLYIMEGCQTLVNSNMNEQCRTLQIVEEAIARIKVINNLFAGF